MKIRSFKPKPPPSNFQPGASNPGNLTQVVEQSAGKFDSLKLIPLGGVGDVTKNMYVYEYKNDILIVDCGMGFPDEAMPGIDLVIPDISYLKDKKSKVRGIIISHGHEDHIGGLPYIWPELNCPIFAPNLAAGFIRAKFTEHGLSKDMVKTTDLNSKLNLGAFNVSFYRVTHSIPDATGIVLDTPVGTIVHQADFKLDWTPVDGQVAEIGKLGVVGEKGVLLLLIDSLRIEKEGYSLSEKSIQPTFEEIEKKAQGKLIITTNSSNISRIQQAINVAVASDRKVSLVGRSMEGNFQVARDLGYLDVPPNLVVPMEEMKRIADEKLLVIIAGSQGQPGSALSRVANNDHRFLTLKSKDSVVFSADPIPSSESAQFALIDKLSRSGVSVYYTGLTDNLHVSGHASSEEIKVMINLARPKFLMPIGATFRHMRAFSQMAQSLGYPEKNILLPEDGKVIEIRENMAVINGRVEVKNIYVDGLGVGDISNIVLRDRLVMSEEGIVLVVLPLDVHTSRLSGEPDIISRGFVLEKESAELLENAKQVVKSALSRHQDQVLDWRFLRRHIEENLEKFFYDETKRRPMVLPVIVEV
ncbi:MAG: ribonuclease J [Candidatus Daviesbacteria bacterium]|nr:ribonuclease J [Candidatus Daviesbacteria bacterium]